MNALLQLLARHGLAAFAGHLAAQGLATDGTTTDLGSAMLILLGASLWSWFAKLVWNTDARDMQVIDDSRMQMARKLLGALCSQGVAALSGYLATQGHTIDANDPVALTLFAGNLGLSKLGLHQAAAQLGAKDALKTLTFVILHSSFVLASSSCTTQQRTLALSLADLGLTAAVARGKVSAGDAILVRESVAVVTSGETTQSKVVKLAEIGLAAAAEKQLIAPGDRILIGEAAAIIHKATEQTAAKAPRDVTPGGQTSASAEAGKAPRDVTPGGQTSASAEVGKAGALPSPSSNLPRGLCLGNPVSCKPSNRAAPSLFQTPQAGQLTTMSSGDAAPLLAFHLPRDDTGD